MDTNTPSATTPANIEDIKPDLRNRSSAMAAVTGVSMGIILGGVLTGVLSAIPAVRRSSSVVDEGFRAAVKRLWIPTSAASGLVGGELAYTVIKSGNDVKDKARPYVERLEAERSALASRLAEVGGGAQKS